MSNVISPHGNRTAKQFVVLGSIESFRKRLGKHRSVQIISTMRGELAKAIERASKQTVWIAGEAAWAEQLSKAVSFYTMRHAKSSIGDLLMLKPATRPELFSSLHSQFEQVVGEVPTFRILPQDQLAEVLSSDGKADLFVGGAVDQQGETITLARGDLSTVTVPLSLFNAQGACKPDFRHFEVDDYGYTLRFGKYEASAHSVLYKIDPAYRRRANQQRILEERGFGPSLRRLRILRRLSRDDFSNISAKTIARIERGETGKPQGATLKKLAKTLNVEPSEIESY